MDSYAVATSHDTFPDATWATSSFCGPNGGNCVAVNRATRGRVGVRDTKAAAGPVLVFAGPEWDAFLNAASFSWSDHG